MPYFVRETAQVSGKLLKFPGTNSMPQNAMGGYAFALLHVTVMDRACGLQRDMKRNLLWLITIALTSQDCTHDVWLMNHVCTNAIQCKPTRCVMYHYQAINVDNAIHINSMIHSSWANHTTITEEGHVHWGEGAWANNGGCYTHRYISIHIYRERERETERYIYIDIYIYIYVSVWVYIYMYMLESSWVLRAHLILVTNRPMVQTQTLASRHLNIHTQPRITYNSFLEVSRSKSKSIHHNMPEQQQTKIAKTAMTTTTTACTNQWWVVALCSYKVYQLLRQAKLPIDVQIRKGWSTCLSYVISKQMSGTQVAGHAPYNAKTWWARDQATARELSKSCKMLSFC